MAIVNPNVARPVGLVDVVATVAGGGDVSGPGVAVDGNFASFDGITGKEIKDSGIPQQSIPDLQKGLGETFISPNPSFDDETLSIDGDFKTYAVITSTFSSNIQLSNTFRDVAPYQELIIKDFNNNALENVIRITREDGATIEGANELLINTNGGEVRVAAYLGNIFKSIEPSNQIKVFALSSVDRNIIKIPSSASTNVARIMWEASTQQLKIFKDNAEAEVLKISFRNNFITAGVINVFPGSGAFEVNDTEFPVATSAYFTEDGLVDSAFDLTQAQDQIEIKSLIDFGNNDFFNIDFKLKLTGSHFILTGTFDRILL